MPSASVQKYRLLYSKSGCHWNAEGCTCNEVLVALSGHHRSLLASPPLAGWPQLPVRICVIFCFHACRPVKDFILGVFFRMSEILTANLSYS